MNIPQILLLVAAAQVPTLAHSATPPKKSPTAAAAPAEKFDPVKSFQAIIASGSAQKNWTRVYLHPKRGKWAKQFVDIGEVKYDVKKTESLVSPVVGLVRFPLSIKQSEFFETQEQAEAADAPSEKLSVQYDVQGDYAASESSWSLRQFKYSPSGIDDPLRGAQFTFTPERLAAEKPTALSEVLKRWLP